MFERDSALRQVAVIGLGRFGLTVARIMADRGHEVLGIDCEEEAVQQAKDVVTHAIQAEIVDEGLVRELGLGEVDVAVVAIGDDVEASIFVTALLVDAGVPLVAARASSHLHGKILERIGADRVIYPEHESGVALAQSLRANNLTAYIELGPDIGISRLDTPKAWVGRRLADLQLERGLPFVVLVIQRGDETIAEPQADEVLRAGDALILLCQESKLDEIPCDQPKKRSRGKESR
ncbi:MAG: TrkA family potassium uptake protein [Chloroflexia bacterium]